MIIRESQLNACSAITQKLFIARFAAFVHAHFPLLKAKAIGQIETEATADFERALASEQFAECYTALDDESVTLKLYAHLKNAADMPLQFGDGIHIQMAEAIDVTPSGEVTIVLGSSKADSVPDASST